MPAQTGMIKNQEKQLPLKIGVTGGIGAGKSMVCKIFQALGVPVYDADSRARELMISDATLVGQIKAQFGPEAYAQGGELNRGYLAEQTFGNPEKLALLNSLVHPRVGLDFAHWVREQATFPYVVKEAALIFESGSYKELDAVVAVAAPEELRIRRTLMRDEHRSRTQIKDIIARQLPEEVRLQKAAYKLINDEKILLIPQVLKLHKTFVAEKVSLPQ